MAGAPMTDIVARLRACNCDIHCKSGCIQEKAADEIERLRALDAKLIKNLAADVKDYIEGWIEGELVSRSVTTGHTADEC
jgi:hypothetical protein